jgi:hypothetical protein
VRFAFYQGCVQLVLLFRDLTLFGRAFLAADGTSVNVVNGNIRSDAKGWRIRASYIAVAIAC